MRSIVAAGMTLFLGLSWNSAYAEAGLHFKAGTLGAGLEAFKSFGDKWSVGLGVNTYDYKTKDRVKDIDYTLNLDLQSVALLAHYHPFAGVFRFTGGVLYNKNELRLTGKPSGSGYVINGTTYSAAQVGSLTGKLSFPSAAPYLGIGWGNAPGGRMGLTADVGVLYQGSPKLSLSATGMAAGLASDLEQERRRAEQDLSNFKWYPVVSLGVYFRF